MSRLIVETDCEHGEMESHYTCDNLGTAEYATHDTSHCLCPGGQRSIVTATPELLSFAAAAMKDVPVLEFDGELYRASSAGHALSPDERKALLVAGLEALLHTSDSVGVEVDQ